MTRCLSVILVLLCGCDIPVVGNTFGLGKYAFDGHTYIVLRNVYSCSMLHDPDCVCKKSGEDK